MDQVIKDGQCDLANIEKIKQGIFNEVSQHLRNGEYLEAVKLETLFQKETSTILAINWKIFKDLSEMLVNNELSEFERVDIVKNIIRMVDVNTAWKMEPFELSMSVKLLKQVTTSINVPQKVRQQIVHLEKEASELVKRFQEDSAKQMKYINEDKSKI